MVRCHAFAIPAVAIVTALATRDVIAQELRINQYWDADENRARIASALSGARIVWFTSGEFCGSDVVMRALSMDGSFSSDEMQVPSNCLVAEPFDVASLPSGDFLVVMRGPDSDGLGIVGRLFDAAGLPRGAEFVINEYQSDQSGTQLDPRVVAMGADRYAVVWERVLQRGPIVGRVVLADGSLPHPEQVISIDPAPSNDPDIACLDGTSCMAIWEQSEGQPSTSYIRVRILDDRLAGIGSDVTLISGTRPLGGGDSTICVCADEYVAAFAWGDYSTPELDEVLAQRVRPDGSPSGQSFQVNDYTLQAQYSARCAGTPDGRVAIAWTSTGQDGSGYGAYAKVYDLAAGTQTPEFRITGMTYEAQIPSDILMTPSGDFMPVWHSYQDLDGTASVFARRYFFPVSLATAPGPDPSAGATVQLHQPDGRTKTAPVTPYPTPGYGATVGAADVDGDASDEVLTGPGPSPVYGPHVRAYEPTGVPLAKVSFFAYGTLKFGVKESGGNVDGDAFAEILTTPGPGAVFGPHVRGFNYDAARLDPIAKVNFFAYGP